MARYRHVGDNRCIVHGMLVEPGQEFESDQEITGNGNFELAEKAAKREAKAAEKAETAGKEA